VASPTYAGGTSTGSPNIQYAPHGSPWLYAMGNGVWHASSYNLRLQVCGIQDVLGGGQTWNGASCSSAPITGGTSLLTATLNWGTANNNGNLQGASYVNSGPGFATPLPFAQGYTYDTVNRLTGVSDTGYTRNFQYDAFGNMYISGSSVITPQGNAPKVANLYNGYNQFIGGAYDAAGNQTVVNGNTITYDAENREAVVAGLGINETYLYDGDGRRVAKGVTGNSPNTVFVYDAMGQLAAEYSTTTNSSPCRTCYLSDDHLGTARLVMDGQGNVVARHDYLPFGEEIAAGQAGRTSQWGPGNDTVNQKFTGKERDSESGLDYFGARYYGSALGRFTSPDKPLIGQNERNPQSWNLYTYVGNNPLARIDPNGESWRVCVDNGNGGQSCRTLNDDEYQSLYNQQNGQQGINLPSGLAGNITCGGSVCGSAVYHEDSLQDESASIGVGIVAGGIVSKAIGGVAGWVAGLFTKTAAETGTTVASRIILTGFSNAEKAMIQKSLTALEAAGYNTGRLKELIKADFGSRMAGMSLGEDGAALANEAFDSPAMLNHVLEEELLHTEQAARGLSAGNGPGAADALEKEVDSMRKFPDPRNQ
jgi:RHS repeat-associated protein